MQGWSLIQIGIYWCRCSVLSICSEFLSDRRQRVVVDGAASEWVPIIAGVPQWSVFGPFLFIQYTSKMFELDENRLFAYADDSTLLAVVRKPADRPAIATSVNRDLARIQEWCNRSCMILNPDKNKALVIFRSITVSPHLVTWSCLGFLSKLVPTSTSLACSLTASSPSKTMWVVLFPVSLRELVFRGWWNIYLWTPLCYFITILHLFTQSLSTVLQREGQLLNVTCSFLSTRCIQWPDFVRSEFLVVVSSTSCGWA